MTLEVFSAVRALGFIRLQLVELARECERMARNQLVSVDYFEELQNKLEKVLYETRSVCGRPPREPQHGDFEFVRQLGRGTFGSVSLVLHKETGRVFAMKTIRKKTLTADDKAQQVLVERDILAFSDSSFVASLFCCFETPKDVCLVMEYAAGGDCRSLLKAYGHFPLIITRLYVAEVTMALDYLHSYGIVHRDVKPDNMLITSSGHIKLVDFGVSKIGAVNLTTDVDKQPIQNIVTEFTGKKRAGTRVYMAPEMINKSGHGKPVDWWALGIITHEFLIGQRPYDGTTREEILYQIHTCGIDWPQGEKALPAEVQDFIRSLLQENCIKRLGTGGAGEVKAHPFFQGLIWNGLLDREIDFASHMETEKVTRDSDSICWCDSQDSDDGSGDKSHVSFSYVAYRFSKVYGTPGHLSSPTFEVQLKKGGGERGGDEEEAWGQGHMEVEEEDGVRVKSPEEVGIKKELVEKSEVGGRKATEVEVEDEAWEMEKEEKGGGVQDGGEAEDGVGRGV